jgi:DALR anticodon binding domain
MKTLLRHGGKWAPGGAPGVYVTRVTAVTRVAGALAAGLGRDPRIEAATQGNGYVTVTLTHDALARVALDVALTGNDCVASDALQGSTVPAAQPADLAAAPDWATARDALARELTAKLARAAGATLGSRAQKTTTARKTTDRSVQKALEFAGADAIRFAVASMRPGGPPPDQQRTARHVLGNPAYAVRYAHAAAAAVLRWAGTGPGPTSAAGFRPSRLTEPGELALLDALSWLPERVAVAARRGRPDEFARYLETLATKTIDTMSTTGFTTGPAVTIERLWLAQAARTALAAGLGLLGIAAPDRI